MYNISLFAEDEAHEDFLTTLAQRLAFVNAGGAGVDSVRLNISPAAARGSGAGELGVSAKLRLL